MRLWGLPGLSLLMIHLCILLSLGCDSFLTSWFILEVQTIFFCAFIADSPFSSFKYFLFQGMFSGLLISGLSLLALCGENLFQELSLLIVFGKLGMAPFFSWFLDFVSRLSVFELFFATTSLKTVGLELLGLLDVPALSMSVFCFLSLVLSFGLFFSSYFSVPLMFGLSSLFNSAWILLPVKSGHPASTTETSLLLGFWLSYSLALAPLPFLLARTTNKGLPLTNLRAAPPSTSPALLLLAVSSLSGLPPFQFFFGKLMLLSSTQVGAGWAVLLMSWAAYLLYFSFFLSLLTHPSAKSSSLVSRPSMSFWLFLSMNIGCVSFMLLSGSVAHGDLWCRSLTCS